MSVSLHRIFAQSTSHVFKRHTVAFAISQLLILTTVGLTLSAVADTAQAQSNVQTYEIPAGSLESALTRFAQDSGTMLSYTANDIAGKYSPGLSGSYQTPVALKVLLTGTGLVADLQPNGGYTLRLVPTVSQSSGDTALPIVTVTATAERTDSLPQAYAGGQVARGGQVGMLGNKDVMDTPFSQTSYTNQMIEDQQARTMQDVLANDSSVVVTDSATTFAWENESIRGFRVNASLAGRSLNGLPGLAPLSAPSVDFIERVEVLKGPSALVNASAASSGNIGGTINLVTKKATDDPVTRLTARYMSRSQFGGHVDIGRRFGANNEFGIRINGTFDKGNTAIRPQESEAGLAAVNLDYRGEHVRLSVDFAHKYQDSGAGSNYLLVRNVASVPKAPDTGKSLFPAWATSAPKTTIGMIRGEVDLARDVTAYASIGAQKFRNHARGVGVIRLLDTTGRYDLIPWTDYKTTDVIAMQGGIRAKATTGQVDHDLNLNLSRSNYKRNSNMSNQGSAIDLGSIYEPVYGTEPARTAYGPLHRVSDTTTSSIAIADTLSFLDQRIQFTAGIRYQKVDSTSWAVATGIFVSDYKSEAWSPAFGLIVKPWQNVSLYANYIEGLEAGTTVGGIYANSGEVFAPYISQQYEAGIKVDWGVVTTTLAAFQIARPNTIAIDSTSGGLPTLALDGEQRNRGIELSAYGELAKGIRLLGGITYIDALQTQTANGLYNGERAMGVPKFRTVIGGEWDTPFISGLTMTGRLAHTTDQVVNNSTPHMKIPSWTQIDVGARHTFASPWNAKPITIRFDVDNLFDKSYWVTAADGYLYAGEPRTFRFSVTANF